MPLRLTDPKTVPKDGFWIVDPTSGRRFGGMFSANYVANEYLVYLKGNNLPGATKAEVMELLDRQTCNRDPRLCYNTDMTVSEQTRQVKAAGCCGRITVS
jgi:hypothetical protein